MALQVWLPLNGNLNNQGLTDITVTNSGATVDNNGKIGKCYSFGTGASGLEIPSSSMNTFTTECSLSMWLYIVSWNNNYATFFQAGKGGYSWNDYIFGVLRIADSSKLCFTITEGISSSTSSFQTPELSLNTWYHLTFVYKSGHCIIYINGELYQDYSTSYVPSFSSISKITLGRSNASTYQTNCKLNDVRIYDHALSPKEVEVLSRGLVCHYPLNGGGRGGDNLLKNTADLTLWAKEGGITTTWDSEKNMYKIEDSTHTNSRWGIYQDIYVEPNSTYTITVTLDGTACGAGFAVYDSSTSFPPAVISTTGRQSYTLTSGANSTKARVYLYTNCGVGKVAWFSLPKVEKSDHTTPWIPNPADSAYTAMGYNSTTEYDVSGYGNNGTKNGTITYLTDTPRYNVSTKIGSTSSYIQIPNLTTTGFSNSYSFAWWGKVPTYTGKMMWGFSDGMRLNGIFNGNLWNTGDGANNPLYVPGTTTQVTVPTVDVWHHWVMTGDGTTCKVYQDGVLWATAKTYKSISGTTIYMNGWDTSTGYTYSEYQMSDFRIYATALSDTQVAELYNTAVSVANNGTLMGYELVEV